MLRMDKVITRLYTGSDGESHFEDYKITMHDQEGFFKWCDPIKVTSIRFGELYSDEMLNWYNAPLSHFVITISGEMVIGIGDGTERVFKPGDVLLAEDTTGKGHTRRRGKNRNHIAAFISVDEIQAADFKYTLEEKENCINISRLYTGEDGESHYQDIYLPILNFEGSNIPLNPQKDKFIWTEPLKATNIIFGDLYNNKPHDWQCVPRRQLVITLDGQVQWSVYDGSTRRFNTGDILLAEDTTGRGHKRLLTSEANHKVAMITLD
jgi:uncharacterized cupin superfamily protein